jgi:hypothetical protein
MPRSSSYPRASAAQRRGQPVNIFERISAIEMVATFMPASLQKFSKRVPQRCSRPASGFALDASSFKEPARSWNRAFWASSKAVNSREAITCSIISTRGW